LPNISCPSVIHKSGEYELRHPEGEKRNPAAFFHTSRVVDGLQSHRGIAEDQSTPHKHLFTMQKEQDTYWA
jgi:hypothetical protein